MSARQNSMLVLFGVCFIGIMAGGIPAAQATSLFINEIHYDNSGDDTGEFIEIAGPAGTDLTGWSLVLYNGNGGAVYAIENLSGTIPDTQDSFGIVVISHSGIQNDTDGIALIDNAGTVVQFLSYEGVFAATDGPANGMNSTDIGVAETGTTPAGHSLQLTGMGSQYEDFTWSSPAANTSGAFNTGQTLSSADIPPAVSGTTPVNSANSVAPDSDIIISFNKNVAVSGSWFEISCSASGLHTASVPDGFAGPRIYTLDPDTDFEKGETCTVTLYGARITDLDETPDNMASDYSFGFSTRYGNLVISEIMYNPDSPDADWEWIEVYNPGPVSADLSGYVLDDNNSSAHGAANISAGSIPAGGSAVLFDGESNSAEDFRAAWGSGIRLIAVTGWNAIGLNNDGDKISIWDSFASYDGDHQAHARAIESVDYGAAGFPDPSGASIYLTDLTFDNAAGENWAASAVDGITPTGTGYKSTAASGNTGNDIGSPGGVTSPSPVTAIHTVQGNGPASPEEGNVVTIEGIVTGDFQDSGELRGFFVQEEDGDTDTDPATSEGIFVYSGISVSLGDKVRVTGKVFEYLNSGSSLTELISVNALTIISSGNPLPAAVTLSMPVANPEYWERCEGMRVTVPQTLTVTGHYNLGRYGEVLLSSAGRPSQFTGMNPPDVAGYTAHLAEIAKQQIVLDDGSTQENPDPIRHPAPGLSASQTLRGGDTVAGLTGILDDRFGAYRIQPTDAVSFTSANSRPASPPDAGGKLRVASFNVLNYFNTFSNCKGGADGPVTECRGADDASEFSRQRNKIISALAAMNADIVGLMEIENDGYGSTSAIQDLISGLNGATGADTYGFVNADAATGRVNALGADAIRVGFIYRAATVSPVGTTAVLNDNADPAFGDDHNRPALAQTFQEKATGRKLTVVVNHFKSKRCGEADGENTDQGDGQGCWNPVRTTAARALVSWLGTDPTGSDDPDFLIIGDLNAYAKEDPLTAIRDAGYTDLISQFGGSGAYSYGYDGQWGYLDHALAGAALTPQVTGAADWHISADEPSALDYNTDGKSDAQKAALYSPDPYRASDHDPVIIGLDLTGLAALTASAKSVTSEAVLLGGTVTEGDNPVTSRGICWGTSPHPGLADTCMADISSGPGPFSIAVTGLKPGTRYYVRTYATDSAGTVFGQQISFSTQPILPEVITEPVAAMSDTTAMAGGSVSFSDGDSVFSRGVCWDTEPEPHTLIQPHTEDGTALGDFVSRMSGLEPDTHYYYRAYAAVQSGGLTYTVYGEEYEFTTRKPGLPGDLNGDKSADLNDVIVALKIVAGIDTDNANLTADVNKDGILGLEEAIYILRHVSEQ